jgi:hypothetical protein
MGYPPREGEAARTVRCRAYPDLVLPCWREGEAIPFNLQIDAAWGALCRDRMRSAECPGGPGEFPSRYRCTNRRTPNWGSLRARLRNRVYLNPASSPPGANPLEAPLSAAPKRALWREHNAPCPRCSDQACKEGLPLCVAHLCVKREIAPLFNACGCESHLKLDGIKEPERRNTAEEKVGVRIKSYVDSMKPRGRSETLSSSQDALMSSV